MKRSGPIKRSTPLRSSGGPRTRTPMKKKARKPSEFSRIYGSKARVAWVKSLPCVVGSLGCDGPRQNAHTANGGMGRKADAHTIVPMCDGHHRLLHAWGVETFSRSYAIDLAECAAHTERRWQSHLAHAGLEHISSIVPRVVAAQHRKESA